MEPNNLVFFRKMNGLGNDFVVLDGRSCFLQLDGHAARAIADRSSGVGCDQLVVLLPSDRGDVRLEFWNRDGSLVESCGNASRCIGDLIAQETGKKTVHLETFGGDVFCERLREGWVEVDMGVPRFSWFDIPLSFPVFTPHDVPLDLGEFSERGLPLPSVVNVGNPHCLFFMGPHHGFDLAEVGPFFESHPFFPQRANISFVEQLEARKLSLRVWERGAGLTKACGTAACAAVVSAFHKGILSERNLPVSVCLPGGDLEITWRFDSHILMAGPLEYDFEGFLPPHLSCLLSTREKI